MILNAIKKRQNGFTLVEILVSMSILLFITVFVLTDYRSANQRSALGNAARKLASDIRLAQQFALGEKEFNGQIPQAWGIKFLGGDTAQDKYYIFADFNQNHWFPSDGSEDNEVYSKIKLPGATNSDIDAENIFISEIFGSTGGGQPDCDAPYTGMIINFEPPKPDTHIVGEGNCLHPFCSYLKDICVILKDNRNGATKTVKVSNLGLVEIIN